MRTPNAAAVQDRGGLYGTDETEDDREIQRKVMRGSLLSRDERGRLENPSRCCQRDRSETSISGPENHGWSGHLHRD